MIPKPQFPNSRYLCWRCMKPFEAASVKGKAKQLCPNAKCGKGGGIVTKIVEVVGKEKS